MELELSVQFGPLLQIIKSRLSLLFMFYVLSIFCIKVFFRHMEQREMSATQLVESQYLPIKGAVSSDTLQVCSQGESDRQWWGSCTKTIVLVSQNDLGVG